MKTIFIPAKSKLEISIKNLPKLPNKLAIAYSIQFKEQANKVKEILSKSSEVVSFVQVLGCSRPNLPKNTQAVILVGQGRFHAIGLAIETNLPIYILEQGEFHKISSEEVQNFVKKQTSSLKNFLNSTNVGILISTKPGQENMKKAINFKKTLKNKNSYLYITNELNISEFENFPQIQSWVNTACPRMDLDSTKIINLNRIS